MKIVNNLIATIVCSLALLASCIAFTVWVEYCHKTIFARKI